MLSRSLLRGPAPQQDAFRARAVQQDQHASPGCGPSTSGAVLKYEIRLARDAAELRSAAYLRAYTFYTYPEDRSPMAARAHRRMKGDAEWDSVTAKVAGKETNYKHMTVKCFISAADDDPNNAVLTQVGQDMDLSTKLPAAPDAGHPVPQLVLGSLDLNIGTVLPAEELVGRLPSQDASTSRAYLSNVCVARAARRLGIAQALIQRAEQEAAGMGVHYLYVHVVHDNTPAVRLYQETLGFKVEAEESARTAQVLQRPRRLLLVKCLSLQGHAMLQAAGQQSFVADTDTKGSDTKDFFI